jgi:hypothetical protein
MLSLQKRRSRITNARIDARRELAAANVADIDQRIAQIDNAVNEATKRGRTATAMNLVEHQTGRRSELVGERARAANALAAVEVEGTGIANERQELAVDSGPVRYLAALIGQDDEKVMHWFVLVVALLLDPLAIALLLAASVSGDCAARPDTFKQVSTRRNRLMDAYGTDFGEIRNTRRVLCRGEAALLGVDHDWRFEV